MRLFHSPKEVPAGFGPSAVTIGKFDGVHVGHRAILGRLRQVAAERGLTALVVTFDRHPFETLAPELCPSSLVSLDQKLELLEESGTDAVLVLNFDAELAALSAEDFVRSVLVESVHAREVLVGADFRFGARGAGTAETLRTLGHDFGFGVELVGDVGEGRRVSSTWIRELLADGDVPAATRLLGRLPSVRGVVVPGAKRGRELGFPTANLSADSEGLIPADGVYAGWLRDGSERHRAAISVGNNPTFEGVPQKQVEAYVLDQDLDLYGHRVEIEFAERIRGMVAFEGITPLVAQMHDDVEQVRVLLG